jgi:GTPase SAR1 family protein
MDISKHGNNTSNSVDLQQIFKIAILGDDGVGKSALACRYVFKKF